MKLLIDTHIFLWWDRQRRKVSRPLRAAIEDADNDVYLSAASIWEIAFKRALGILNFDRPIVQSVAKFGFEILPVSREHAEHAEGCPAITMIPLIGCWSHKFSSREWSSAPRIG